MAIAPFPHQYSVTLERGELTAPPRAPIRAGTPPQFGGSDDVWSPEELLVAASLSCLQATFEAYANRAKLAVLAWRGSATGTLEKGSGGPVFTSIALAVDIEVEPGEEERASQLLASAERACIITRALNVPVKLNATVHPRDARATA